MKAGPSPARDSAFFHFLSLGVAVFIVFGLALWAPFLYDDVVFLRDYSEVTGPWRGVRHWLLTPLLDTREYEPLPVLLHRLLFLIAGDKPWPYHLGNLILHWVNAGLFYFLARRLLASAGAAFFSALVFALYPGHVEIVAVATFKKHLLVFFFTLAVLHLQDNHRLPRWLRLSGCWASLALALLCKESALLIPAVALLFRGTKSRDGVLYAGMALACAAYVIFRTTVMPRYSYPLQSGLISHLLTSGKCLLWYLSQLVLPLGLCQEHSLAVVPAGFSWQGLGIAAALVLAAAGLLWLWRRQELYGTASAWALLSLAPFLNLLPFVNLSLVANRYLYMASAAFALGLGFVFRSWSLRRWAGLPLTTSAGAILCLFYASTAMAALSRYSDPVELWSRTTTCAPENPRGYSGLASALRQRGRLAEAETALRRAVALSPESYAAWASLQLAEVLAGLGREEEALALARRQMEREPWMARGVIGALLMGRGKYAQAKPFLEEAYRRGPESPEVAVSLGECYFNLKEWDLAENVWTKALVYPAHRLQVLSWLGILALERGQLEKAGRFYEQAVALEPRSMPSAWQLAQIRRRAGDKEGGRRVLAALVAALESSGGPQAEAGRRLLDSYVRDKDDPPASPETARRRR